MGYEKGREKDAQGIFQCEKILASHETYDYALISALWIGTQAEIDTMGSSELTAAKQSTGSGFSALSPEDFPVVPLYGRELSKAMSIVIASHPRGRLKEIERSSDCKIHSTEIITISMLETMIHSCDTEVGSSGSPVLSPLHGAIVGLHWGGSRTSHQNFMIPISSVYWRTGNVRDHSWIRLWVVRVQSGDFCLTNSSKKLFLFKLSATGP